MIYFCFEINYYKYKNKEGSEKIVMFFIFFKVKTQLEIS